MNFGSAAVQEDGRVSKPSQIRSLPINHSIPEHEVLLAVGAAYDAAGVELRPAVAHLRGNRLAGIGRPEMFMGRSELPVVERQEWCLLPGFVNAHCHLDLSSIGPRAFGGDFAEWVNMVQRERAREGQELQQSVETGIERARRGGTALVGDIGGMGSREPYEALLKSELGGVCFLEYFGLGRNQGETCERMEQVAAGGGAIRLGLQPHAPYSAGGEVYRRAAELARRRGLPVCTHLAETEAEIEFTRNASGPMAEFLRRIGKWDETISGTGLHPIDAVADALAMTPWTLAHVNYCEDRHIEMLAGWGATVAYCPRASDYFGHRGHRYREMARAGVNVALGTDSIICLPTAERISIWDEMRYLAQRDGMDALTLLAMGTVNGARALQADESEVTLAPGIKRRLNLVRFDPRDARHPLDQALRGDEGIELRDALKEVRSGISR